MALRAKHFEYWVTIDEAGAVSAEGHPIPLDDDVSAEHLLLGGLARCSMSSFAYFARQKGVEARGSAVASGTVTRRAEDDRYAFVDIECTMNVQIDGELPEEDLRALARSAEWGCFVGASLNPPPRYSWRVNGRRV